MAATSPRRSAAQRVAIVSDGSALPDGQDLTSALRNATELISGLAQLPAKPAPIFAPDAEGLAAGIRALPVDVGAVLLTHVEPDRARQVRQELRERGGRPLVTDEDITAISFAVAALGTLNAAGRLAPHSRVVLAGTRDLPLLIPLLMVAGVGDLTIWQPSDSAVFPLHNAVFGADVVIDYVGELPSTANGSLAGTTVITRADTGAAPYAAAGLLQAAMRHVRLNLDVEVFSACVRALMTTPVNHRPVPHLKGIALTRLVVEMVTSLESSRA